MLDHARAGRHVVVHCRDGIDRSSLLAGALLVMDGASPEAAWQAISEARGRNVPESDEQRAWLTTFDEDADHALPDPAAALNRWRALLKPNGRLILVEGRWSTGAGLTAAECVALPGEGNVHPLTDPILWGCEITDERYLVQT